MISIIKAKEILCKYGDEYTDEEIKKIRRFLQQLAETNVEKYRKQNNHEKRNFNGKGLK